MKKLASVLFCGWVLMLDYPGGQKITQVFETQKECDTKFENLLGSGMAVSGKCQPLQETDNYGLPKKGVEGGKEKKGN